MSGQRFKVGERLTDGLPLVPPATELAVDPDLQDLSCPCGGTFSVARTAKGEPALAHKLPACASFLDRDPVDFMHWVRVTTSLGLQ